MSYYCVTQYTVYVGVSEPGLGLLVFFKHPAQTLAFDIGETLKRKR